MTNITDAEIDALQKEFVPLLGLKISWLSLPEKSLPGFEPSQIAVIVNTILDAALPQIELLSSDPENNKILSNIGLAKAPGSIGQREHYPDYIHKSGYRVELKGLYVDNHKLKIKRPPTRREPSARLKENVTVNDVNPEKDVLMLAAVQLQESEGICVPVIIDIGLFSMIDCINARDSRLLSVGGRWLRKIPQVVKSISQHKYRTSSPLSDSDYEKDTNFGKLKRIPYPKLQAFMRKHGAV